MTARGRRVRPFFAKVHRYAGLGMALFLIVNGLTGALLAFYHELDQALNPGLFRVQERRTAALGPNALVAAVQKAYPDTQVSFLALHRADRESVHVRLSPGNKSADGNPNAARRINALLAGAPFPAKANLINRFYKRPDRDASYLPLPSPLAYLGDA